MRYPIIQVLQRGICGINGAWIDRSTENVVIVSLDFSTKWLETSGVTDKNEFCFDVYQDKKSDQIDRRNHEYMTIIKIDPYWMSEYQSVFQVSENSARICLFKPSHRRYVDLTENNIPIN